MKVKVNSEVFARNLCGRVGVCLEPTNCEVKQENSLNDNNIFQMKNDPRSYDRNFYNCVKKSVHIWLHCKNCDHNCEDHSSFDFISAVHIWFISYASFTIIFLHRVLVKISFFIVSQRITTILPKIFPEPSSPAATVFSSDVFAIS